MQKNNSPPKSSPPANVPLEEQGHLSRTHLYILLAILSVAVILLCGYTIWDKYQIDESSSQTEEGSKTIAKDESTPEETSEAEQETHDIVTEEEDINTSHTIPEPEPGIEHSNSLTRRFYIRPAPDADVAFFLEAELSLYHIEYHEGPGGGAQTVIVLNSGTSNESELYLGTPHIALLKTFSSPIPITNSQIDGLYRIPGEPSPISNHSNAFFYSNQVTLTGECSDPTGTYTAPCGWSPISFSDTQSVHVVCETDNENPSSCDEVMETLSIVE